MQVQVRVSSACVTKNIYLIRVKWAAQVHWEVEVEVQLQVCRVFLQKKGISYMYTWKWKYNWQCKHNRLCKYKDKFVPCVSPTPYIQYKYNGQCKNNGQCKYKYKCAPRVPSKTCILYRFNGDCEY